MTKPLFANISYLQWETKTPIIVSHYFLFYSTSFLYKVVETEGMCQLYEFSSIQGKKTSRKTH